MFRFLSGLQNNKFKRMFFSNGSTEKSPVLYYDEISPPVRSVFMTIQALDLKVKLLPIDLVKQEQLSDDFLRINPLQKVPTMITQESDVIITDSHAICAHLVNRYAKGSNLYPEEPGARARVDSILYFNNGILFPRESAILNSPFHRELRDAKGFSDAVLRYMESLSYLESFCQKHKWLCGEHMTIADLCCISTYSTGQLMVPLEHGTFPATERWAKMCESQEFYRKANVPGLEKLKGFLKNYGNFDHLDEENKTFVLKNISNILKDI